MTWFHFLSLFLSFLYPYFSLLCFFLSISISLSWDTIYNANHVLYKNKECLLKFVLYSNIKLYFPLSFLPLPLSSLSIFLYFSVYIYLFDLSQLSLQVHKTFLSSKQIFYFKEKKSFAKFLKKKNSSEKKEKRKVV